MDFLNTLPLLQIHVTAVFTTLAIVVIADLHGIWWMLGKTEVLPVKRMKVLHYLVWTGLVVITTAGLTMFSSYSEYLLSLPAFQLKLVFITSLLLNAVFIGKHLPIATKRSFASLSKKERSPLLVSGAISALGWIGAFTCAQFL